VRPKPRVRIKTLMLSPKFSYLRPYETHLVRIGPNSDCGYVIPVSVANSTKSLYSIGISSNWDFEIEMVKRNPGLRIRAYDRTSGWLVFAYWGLRDLLRGDPSINGVQTIGARIQSAKKYFSLAIRSRFFFWGKRRFRRLWVRSQVTKNDEISFRQSIEGIFVSGFTMIKIDIEGGEYQLADELINTIKDNVNSINCVVMELHDTSIRRNDFERLVLGVSALLPIVHLHGNNCASTAEDGLPHVIEITFANISNGMLSKQLRFPITGLDFANDSSLPDCEMNFLG